MKGIINSQGRGVEWLVVYATHNLQEAHIVAGRLQSEGVPAMVDLEPGASAIGITFGVLGEKRVLVRPEDYKLALEILRLPDQDELMDTTDKIIYHSDTDDEDEAGDE